MPTLEDYIRKPFHFEPLGDSIDDVFQKGDWNSISDITSQELAKALAGLELGKYNQLDYLGDVLVLSSPWYPGPHTYGLSQQYPADIKNVLIWENSQATRPFTSSLQSYGVEDPMVLTEQDIAKLSWVPELLPAFVSARMNQIIREIPDFYDSNNQPLTGAARQEAIDTALKYGWNQDVPGVKLSDLQSAEIRLRVKAESNHIRELNQYLAADGESRDPGSWNYKGEWSPSGYANSISTFLGELGSSTIDNISPTLPKVVFPTLLELARPLLEGAAPSANAIAYALDIGNSEFTVSTGVPSIGANLANLIITTVTQGSFAEPIALLIGDTVKAFVSDITDGVRLIDLLADINDLPNTLVRQVSPINGNTVSTLAFDQTSNTATFTGEAFQNVATAISAASSNSKLLQAVISVNVVAEDEPVVVLNQHSISFDQDVARWASGQVFPDSGRLLSMDFSQAQVDFTRSYHRDSVYGVSVGDILTLNPWVSNQRDTQNGYWWQTSGQTLTLPTANWQADPFLNGSIRDTMSVFLSNPGFILPNLPQLAPTVNINPFPTVPNSFQPTLHFDPIYLNGISTFLSSMPVIGAFYEGGELLYDDSTSIAHMTARLYIDDTAVTSSVFDSLDSNSDGVINESDSDFANVEVWRDMNENGIIEVGELNSLSDADIDSISLTDEQFHTSGNAAAVEPEDVDAFRASLAASIGSGPSAPSEPSAPTDSPPSTPSGWTVPGSVQMASGGSPTAYYILGTDSGETIDDDYDASYQNVPNIIAFGGNDTLLADDVTDTTDNTFWSGTGNDQFASGAGNDRLIGDTGTDLAYGQLGNDTIWGGDDADTLVGFYQTTDSLKSLGSGDSDNDLILGGSGNDTIIGQVGNDTLSGEAGNDVITGFTASDDTKSSLNQYESDNDVVFGGAGTDTLIGQVGNDTLVGGDDADVLLGFYDTPTHAKHALVGSETDNDILIGGGGNDTLIGFVGEDTLAGGDGNDFLNGYTFSDDSVNVDLGEGESDDDVILGGAGADTLVGQVGNDTLSGGDDNDLLHGFYYNTADEKNALVEDETDNDFLLGGAGNDTLVGFVGNDTLSGDDGNDLLVGYTYSDDEVSVDLGDQTDNDVLAGGAGADTAFGGVGDDTIDGGSGNDLIIGFYGISGSNQPDEKHELVDDETDNDVVMAGDGNDTVFGQIGDDTIFGDAGDDFLNGFNSANDPAQTLATGQSDDDLMVGGEGNDTVLGMTGDDRLYGSEGNDFISGADFALDSNYSIPEGETDNDTLWGGTGNDEMQGRQGNDFLLGEAGDDRMFGQVGDDTLYGGEGDDVLVGFTASNEVKQSLEEGETDDDHLYGGGGKDLLLGRLGNDYLDGGAGADTMVGGTGNDTYIVNTINDEVVERASEGTDRVFSSVTHLLAANSENLYLLGNADIHGTGNKQDNAIYGTSGDILDGVTGVDTMTGFAGDDTYYVDDEDDVIVEQADQGRDAVQSSITWTLENNLEDLRLLSYSVAEKGRIDGQDVNVYGFPKRFELDYLQGDTVYDYLGTCAIATISNLIIQTGGTASEQDVLEFAIANDLTITAQESNDALLRGGTTMSDQLQLLEHFGRAASSHIGFDLEEVAEKVKAGHGVLLAVNAGHLWNTSASVGNGNVNHTITITGVVYDSTNTDIVGFYIADSGRGIVSDMTRYVSYEDLATSANVGNAYFLYITTADKPWNSDIDGTGNSLDNMIVGTDGNNVLDGMAGADSLVGGDGDDTYIVDDADDLVFENEDEGTDSVTSSVSFAIVGGVENLTLTGSSNLTATGNTLDNTLTGNSGANTLDGGVGADTMIGGSGNDTYVVDDSADVVTEASSSGTDLVQASASYTLSANVENLTLTGTADIDGTGNSLVNTITGNAGNNVIDGGAAIDSMTGGEGNDTYVVDDASDVVVEHADEGSDTIQAGFTYSIASLANFENITLTGSSAINATGNDADNALRGNSGDNELTGDDGNDTLDGGEGEDTLTGGLGDDVYVADDADDEVVENSSEGTDTIQTALTYSLAALTAVENLTLTGNGEVDATGNDLANVLTGNSATNVLTGGIGNDTLDGGLGDDSLLGGTGNDTFVVDSLDDVVTENSSEGTDTVQTGITYSLAAISHVENLTLTGTGNIDATGNSLANILTGNACLTAAPVTTACRGAQATTHTLSTAQAIRSLRIPMRAQTPSSRQRHTHWVR